MKTYKIEITETLSRTIEIEANTIDEAFSKAKELYQKEEIVLDADDFVNTDFQQLED